LSRARTRSGEAHRPVPPAVLPWSSRAAAFRTRLSRPRSTAGGADRPTRRASPPVGVCRAQPIRLFAGAFGGATLYGNHAYTSPNAQRSAAKAKLGQKYADKKAAQDARAEHLEGTELARDPVESIFKG